MTEEQVSEFEALQGQFESFIKNSTPWCVPAAAGGSGSVEATNFFLQLASSTERMFPAELR